MNSESFLENSNPKISRLPAIDFKEKGPSELDFLGKKVKCKRTIQQKEPRKEETDKTKIEGKKKNALTFINKNYFMNNMNLPNRQQSIQEKINFRYFKSARPSMNTIQSFFSKNEKYASSENQNLPKSARKPKKRPKKNKSGIKPRRSIFHTQIDLLKTAVKVDQSPREVQNVVNFYPKEGIQKKYQDQILNIEGYLRQIDFRNKHYLKLTDLW